MKENPALNDAFPVGEGGAIDESYLQTSIRKIFLNLDLDENQTVREEIINKIAAHIETLESKSEHQQVFMKCRQ